MQTSAQVGKSLMEKAGRKRKIIIANWKMNVPDLSEWTSFPSFESEVVICPPYSHLEIVRESISNVKLGAQDTFWEEKGSYTGEISPEFLEELGAEYVIIGHSDRRNKLGETDEIVNKKLLASLKEGLKTILCVGEPKEIRDLGLESAKNFVKNQIEKDLKDVPAELYSSLLIAYEPIWAISTTPGAQADTPENAVEMLKFIKGIFSDLSCACFVYGGSVTPENAQGFLEKAEIEGALVGGASLKAEEFQKIISIADNVGN